MHHQPEKRSRHDERESERVELRVLVGEHQQTSGDQQHQHHDRPLLYTIRPFVRGNEESCKSI